MVSNKMEQDQLKIKSIIFSYDRAMQLDANLRSFFIHCTDHELANMTVLYRVSDEKNKTQYLSLAKEYPQVQFIHQNDFRNDVLTWMSSGNSRAVINLYKTFTSLFVLSRNSKFFKLIFNRYVRRFLLNLFPYKKDQFLLFLVDDNIFTRDFSLKTVIHHLQNQPNTLGFSLRLGKNTTYCYALDSVQSIPTFSVLDDNVLLYRWPEGEYDFAYPLEISSSVYRTKQIFPLLLRLMFSNPNTLEGGIAAQAPEFRKKLPYLLTFEISVAFCNPINIVQRVMDNNAGNKSIYSASSLSQLFNSGKRVDVNAFNQFISNGCHQEVDLAFSEYNNNA